MIFNSNIVKAVLPLCLLVAVPSVCVAAVKKVSGEYTYYGDKNDSPAMSKAKALEGARVDAISKEFGTIVSQDIMQADRVGASEESKFFSLSATEVKGEWIADDGEPVFTVSLGADDCLVVTCKIKGTAKEISNASSEFDAVALRNGNTKGNASTEYHEGDQLYLYFSSPQDGYVAVFVMDEQGDVVQMLPYPTGSGADAQVKKNYDYVFFDDTKAGGPFGDPDAFVVTTNGDVDFNKMYVVFSPNAFSRPLLNNKPREEGGLPYATEEDFSKWLVKSRRNDEKMGVKQINLKLYGK